MPHIRGLGPLVVFLCAFFVCSCCSYCDDLCYCYYISIIVGHIIVVLLLVIRIMMMMVIVAISISSITIIISVIAS